MRVVVVSGGTITSGGGASVGVGVLAGMIVVGRGVFAAGVELTLAGGAGLIMGATVGVGLG